MEKTKKISIIVPVYNAEKYLRETVECILRQTYKDFELLLVDDGSKDSSPSMCDEFVARDNRVVVYHNDNMGPAEARTFGISKATGEFIAFIDSDDLIEDDYLEQLIGPFDNSEVDLSLCGFDRFYNDDLTNQVLYPLGKTETNVLNSVKEVAMLFTEPRTSLSGVSIWAKIYKKSIIQENDIKFPEGISYEEDCCFNLLYFRHIRKAVTIQKNLYHYRQVANSLSKAYKESTYTDLLNGYNERVKLFKEIDMGENNIKKLDNIFLMVTFNNMKKVATSKMSMWDRRKAYKSILSHEETRRIIDNCGISKVRLTKYLTLASRKRNITAISLLLFVWKLRGGEKV